MSEKSYNFTCSLCGRRPKKKAFISTPKAFPSFLRCLNRKQQLRVHFMFPKFREGDFVCCACHSRLYKYVRKWKTIGVDSSVTCSLCGYEIEDNEKMIVPPCNDFRHALHFDCCEFSLNGCCQCRVGHSAYRSRLRQRKNFLSGWTVL
jgi:hypothetical protein